MQIHREKMLPPLLQRVKFSPLIGSREINKVEVNFGENDVSTNDSEILQEFGQNNKSVTVTTFVV